MPAGISRAEGTFHARSAFHKFQKGFISLKKALAVASAFFMAAEEGFEPSQTESESVVLPLHNSAIDLTLIIISHTGRFVNSFFTIFDIYLKILRRTINRKRKAADQCTVDISPSL